MNESFLNSSNIPNDASTDIVIYPWLRYVLGFTQAGFFIFGVLGHSLVVFVLWHTKQKSSTDIYLLWLSLVDVTHLLLNIPMFVMISSGLWPYVTSSVLCKIHHFLYIFHFNASTILFSIIGLHRYLLICKGNSTNFLHRRPGISSLLCVFASVLLSHRRILRAGLDEKGNCSFKGNSDESVDMLGAIQAVVLLGGSCIIVYVYIRIILFMRRKVMPTGIPLTTVASHVPSYNIEHNNLRLPRPSVHARAQTVQGTSSDSTEENRPRSRYTKSSNVLIAISALYLGCTVFPTLFLIILDRMDCEEQLEINISQLVNQLLFVNTVANPYMYYKMNRAFRLRVRQALGAERP